MQISNTTLHLNTHGLPRGVVDVVLTDSSRFDPAMVDAIIRDHSSTLNTSDYQREFVGDWLTKSCQRCPS